MEQMPAGRAKSRVSANGIFVPVNIKSPVGEGLEAAQNALLWTERLWTLIDFIKTKNTHTHLQVNSWGTRECESFLLLGEWPTSVRADRVDMEWCRVISELMHLLFVRELIVCSAETEWTNRRKQISELMGVSGGVHKWWQSTVSKLKVCHFKIRS